ncbi:TPA: hypothetical protein ACUKZR_000668, partial [Escherichia coli]
KYNAKSQVKLVYFK